MKILPLLLCCTFIGGSIHAAVIFEEDFGTLASTTTITTSNTDLTYVRIGSGGGSIEALNPSTVGSGASVFITGPSGTSLNGIGVQSTLDFGTDNLITLSLDFSLTASAGQIVIGLGLGSTFTGNTVFNTTQGFFWLQINETQIQRRTSLSAWSNIGTAISLNTTYNLTVETDTVTGLMDVILNGTKIADQVVVTTSSIDPNGFRIYAVNGSSVEIDNISITAIPEPAAAVFGSIGMFFLLRRRR